MLKKFYPYEYVDSVFSIDYEELYKQGYRGIIFDLDNTLVHHGDSSTKEVDELFKQIQSIGLKTIILTNNDEDRVKRFLTNIDSLYICDAVKPETISFLQAVDKLGIDKDKVVYIGDQIFVDVVGANKSGLANILVKFIRLPSETKIGKRRQIEKIILKFYKMNKKYQHRLGNIVKKEHK